MKNSNQLAGDSKQYSSAIGNNALSSGSNCSSDLNNFEVKINQVQWQKW